MIIPGFLISWITFPGVIVHEFAHDLFCRWCRVAVHQVCYFRFGNPSGYVLHEEPRHVWQQVLIGVGPFIVNSVVGSLIAFPAAVTVLTFKSGDGLDIFLMWLGISITMHAFPSTGDAKTMWKGITGERSTIAAKLLGAPIVGLVYLGAAGSFFWLDLIYGVALVAMLPHIAIWLGG